MFHHFLSAGKQIHHTKTADRPTEDEMTPQGLATLRRLEGMLGGGGGGGDGSVADSAVTESSGAQFEDADDMES